MAASTSVMSEASSGLFSVRLSMKLTGELASDEGGARGSWGLAAVGLSLERSATGVVTVDRGRSEAALED